MSFPSRPTVLILFDLPMGSDPFALISDGYRQAYETLYTLAQKNGIRLLRAPLEWYDVGHNTFTQAIGFEGGRWQTIDTGIEVHAIYDKANTSEDGDLYEKKLLLAKRYPFINHPSFTKIIRDKNAVSQLIPQHFKPYYRITTNQELASALAKIPGEYFVVKPERGSGGEGVIIDTPQKLIAMDLEYPLILQEFIDSSNGIPGITAGYHDLRLVFINDDLIYGYIRIPKTGSLLANIAQGGSMEIIEEEKLPRSLEPVIRDVHKAFAHFPKKIYTIDLIFDAQVRPWIIELNSMPGIYFSPGQEATRDRFYQALINNFKDVLEQ